MRADIRVAETDDEIAACGPLMRELRPHIGEHAFVSRVLELQESGYFLAYMLETDPETRRETPRGDIRPVAVAGARINENLAWGRFLYVDDLVVREDRRSQGYGATLLSWLCDVAAANGCGEIHLDSQMQRKEAHRFYEREGLEGGGIHFLKKIP